MTLKQLNKYLRGIPKALEKAMVRGIQVGAERAISIAVEAGDKAVPASPNGSEGAFDTGLYRRSWKTKKQKDGAILYNSSKQSDIIERGRRPGRRMPPLRVAEQWARRRLGLSPKEAKLAAYPIARAIGKRGLLARRVLAKATPDIIGVVMTEVRAEVRKALRAVPGGGE